ncbi:MAG: hypothetical protein U0586_03575 [Candidatus Brocadiaceae bacterium]
MKKLYRDKIIGAISGLDRIRFRGTMRRLASERGLSTFMNQARILLKDFSGWVNGLTAQVRESCESRAKDLGIEVRYLTGSGVDKDTLARQIAAAQVEEKLKEVVCGACNKVVKEGKRYRGLNPWQHEKHAKKQEVDGL